MKIKSNQHAGMYWFNDIPHGARKHIMQAQPCAAENAYVCAWHDTDSASRLYPYESIR